MRQKSQTRQTGAAKAIKDIRRATRKQYRHRNIPKYLLLAMNRVHSTL
jgi:hypothetical protein